MRFGDVASGRPIVVVDEAFEDGATRALVGLASMGHPSKADATVFIATSMGVLCRDDVTHLQRKGDVGLQFTWSQVTQLGYPVKHRDGVSVPPPRVRCVVCVQRANKVLVVHNYFPVVLGEDKAVWSMRVRYLQGRGDY